LYGGQQADPNTGLYNLRARYYDPSLGAFLSRDPVEGVMGRAMSYNGYSYVEGNPVNAVYPSGMCIWDGCIAEILAIGAGVAFIGDWVHQVFVNRAKGLDWGQAVYGGNLNGGELVAAAGVGAISTGVVASAGILTLGALGITTTSGTAQPSAGLLSQALLQDVPDV
jgi:RHS repeat-associated protein